MHLPTLASLTVYLHAGGDLAPAEIALATASLLSLEVDETSKGDFLTALRTKGETAAEIAGFAQALLAHAVDPGIDPAQAPGPLLDVCGTGGDQLHLFNVSTTVMFILAAGGAAVVKHGNRAITSQSGGADVLEALGVRIDLPPAQLRECVYRHGVGFLFAPAYHPAFKAIGPVRKRLAAVGIPTIFNLLGPLLNPARPARQLIGLFSRELLDKYAAAVALLPREVVWVVHGDGMDELSTTGRSDIREIRPASKSPIRSTTIHPADLGFATASVEQLRGGDRARNAEVLTGILSGEIGGPMRDVVVLNAAAAFVVRGESSLPQACARARELIDSGAALRKLEALRDFSRSAG
jgi:anthranilate phosphoribosyltransferase